MKTIFGTFLFIIMLLVQAPLVDAQEARPKCNSLDDVLSKDSCLRSPSFKPNGALWEHNGSTVSLVAEGQSRRFFYKEPRPGMLSAGAQPGTILFEGEAIGDQYRGTAYLFISRCGKLPYQVSGPIVDNYRRVELRGLAPCVDKNCRIIGYTEDLLAFRMIEPAGVVSANTPSTAVVQAPAPPPTVRQADEVYRPRPGEAYYPAIYCYWNRSGLPAAQQKICSDRDKKNAEAAARTQANASPALLEYENIMRPLTRYAAVAYYAAICGVRSNRYLKLFQNAHIVMQSDLQRSLHLSDADINAAAADHERIFRDTRLEISTAPDPNHPGMPRCADLVNSPIIDETDQAERKLTGNYH